MSTLSRCTFAKKVGTFFSCSIFPASVTSFHTLRQSSKLFSTDDVYICNVEIGKLSRAGNIKAARKLFDQMHNRDVVSWNAIVSGYWQNGDQDESKRLFESMPVRNVVSWNCMIAGCVSNGGIDEAFEYFQMMPERNNASWNAMLSGFVRYDRFEDARRIFEEMPRKNVISYTAMIDGYAKSGEIELARTLFDSMRYRNDVTWTVMISGYVENDRFDEAKELFERMPDKNIAAMTSMLIGYCKEGKMENARILFDQIQNQDQICWNAIITGYAQNDNAEEAIKLYSEMMKTGVKPDEYTLVSVLTSCSNLASLNDGRQTHVLVIKTGMESSLSVCNALIIMYSKCGCIINSELAFTQITCPDLITWNTIVTAFAQHGLVEKAFDTFREMGTNCFKPDGVTFLSLLSACGHVGKLKESIALFKSMVIDHGITPRYEHYACLVDILSRSGELKKAFKIIQEMPFEPDSKIWGALLGACVVHSDVELGELAAREILVLDPKKSGAYIMLSNIYAAAGMWRDVTRVRVLMKEQGVIKQRACSWMEVGDVVHSFLGGDISHPDIDTIHLELKRIRSQMKTIDDIILEM